MNLTDILADASTFTKTVELGEALQRHDASNWEIGDILVEGSARESDGSFVPGALTEAAVKIKTMTGKVYTTSWLGHQRTVAEAFPPGQRFESLTFTHHAEALSLPPEQRQRVLGDAAVNGWTTDKVREAAGKAAKHLTIDTATVEQISDIIGANPGAAGKAIAKNPAATAAFYEASAEKSATRKKTKKRVRKEISAKLGTQVDDVNETAEMYAVDMAIVKSLLDKANPRVRAILGAAKKGTLTTDQAVTMRKIAAQATAIADDLHSAALEVDS